VVAAGGVEVSVFPPETQAAALSAGEMGFEIDVRSGH
jgi:hypothetical protein